MSGRVTVRVLLLVSLLIVWAAPALAYCVRYECKRGQDLASCYERYGPLARNFILGSSCQEVYTCIWSYNPVTGGWGSSCSYACQIEQCYEI